MVQVHHKDNSWLTIGMTLMVYLKMLITFKIFLGFRKLIPLIMACLYEMRTFLILLLLSIVTFAIITFKVPYKDGNTNTTLSFPEHINAQYRMMFGENAEPEYEQQYFLYVLFTLFVNVTMLNLLVSILGDEFDK